ncbi:MAG: DegT/DnrJ/EryC1/StrS family aminotransferase [Actinomycetota bacterium]|nr:DegT/DnrJ/EryC1/StrS family aminotransferase [Actinomycetota bacterium]
MPPPNLSAQRKGIPLSRPYIAEREEELVLDVLRSGRLSLGPTIQRFEETFAERVGAPYAAAVSSGTSGLHLLSHLAGLGSGAEVITSPISFVATANCFIYEGATPVFADVDARTLSLDPAAVEAAITERTQGIVAVDMFGYPCELDDLGALADEHGLALILDSCEALGAEYRGRPVGSHGPPAAFGFYPNKQITTGEGGVVTTHAEDEWLALKSLRNQGRSYDSRWFHHIRLGFNYRLTDLQAALGLAQLEKLDEILALRREAAERYGTLLAAVDGVEPPHPDNTDHRRSWFVYVVKLARGVDRDAVTARLAEDGIEAGHYVPCVHLQPYMRERYGFAEGVCPVAEDAASRTLALPFFTAIELEDQERVVESLRGALER